MAEPARRPGRPRDPSIDERALAATRELLVERGFEATTIQAVAAQLRCARLRHLPPLELADRLIEEATFPVSAPERQPTGDLRRDLRRFVRAYAAAFDAPAARAAGAGLIAHHQTTNQQNPPELYLRVSTRPQFQDIPACGATRQHRPRHRPRRRFGHAAGAILARTVLSTVTTRRRPLERIVELILRLLQPQTSRYTSA